MGSTVASRSLEAGARREKRLLSAVGTSSSPRNQSSCCSTVTRSRVGSAHSSAMLSGDTRW